MRSVTQTNERSPREVRRPISVARAAMIGRRQPLVVDRIGTVRTWLRKVKDVCAGKAVSALPDHRAPPASTSGDPDEVPLGDHLDQIVVGPGP
jgi:hypothetical protein